MKELTVTTSQLIDFDLAYEIALFRDVQGDFFNEEGEPYNYTGFGSSMCGQMLSLINNLEAALRKQGGNQ